MDVEGNELKVLRGMKNVLGGCEGFAIYFEYYPVAIVEVGLKQEDLWGFLGEFEYDQIMVEGNDTYKELGSMEALILDMKTHASHIDHRGAGTVGNYLVARGMNS